MTTQQTYFNPRMFAPVRELLVPEVAVNPFPWFKLMRETTPVRYDEVRDTWDVFTYDLAVRILQDTNTFTSRRMPPTTPIAQSMIFVDPPRHTQLRNLVSKAFTPARIAAFQTRIEEITNELLDGLANVSEMDVVRDFAVPLPVRVIAELIGIPEEDHHAFKDWSDVFMKTADAPTPESMEMVQQAKAQASAEFCAYLGVLTEKRRQEPQGDLISTLLEAEVDGVRLTEIEVMAFLILLLVAGNETTTNLITHGVRCLIDHPEALAQLIERPELINSAVEEVLRYTSPAKLVERVATVDVELDGHLIKAGQGVSVWTGSINRDESKFAGPERFIIDRNPNPHLAFGFGIHFCLGAPLARLEAQVALGAMVKRLKGMRYAPDMTLEPILSNLVYGFNRLQIRYEI